MTTTNTQVRMIGITDESSVCDCCGKTNLKRVVVLDMDGEIVRYGSMCASKAMRKSYGLKVEKAGLEGDMKIIAYYQKWATKVTAQQLAAAIWNTFGRPCEWDGKDGIRIAFKLGQYVLRNGGMVLRSEVEAVRASEWMDFMGVN